MFKQRLLTTLILIPVVFAAIYFADYWWLAAVILMLTVGCAFEWTKLIPCASRLKKISYLLLMLAACYLIQKNYSAWLIIGLISWLLIISAIMYYPRSQVWWGNKIITSFAGLLLLPLFAQSLINIFLLKQGKALFIYLLILVWAVDIGAYLSGKTWGKHKLIPAVSPGKTIEGVLGGLLLVILTALISEIYFMPVAKFRWAMIAVIIAGMAMAGDLLISMLKRRVALKDTGNILPGHGGILDRLDSLIAAAPFFYGCMQYLMQEN